MIDKSTASTHESLPRWPSTEPLAHSLPSRVRCADGTFAHAASAAKSQRAPNTAVAAACQGRRPMGRVRGGCEVMVGPAHTRTQTQRDAGRRSASTSRQANNNKRKGRSSRTLSTTNPINLAQASSPDFDETFIITVYRLERHASIEYHHHQVWVCWRLLARCNERPPSSIGFGFSLFKRHDAVLQVD